ncbi:MULTISPECIES: SRPBCC family protein [Rhodococcus]|uniref:Coenzyme Q-binding protein COQ10 START domain-containing protein n=2 Tax=Rhodococcus opacus TaxID=37919 RepID=K8Y000_RHOOP|nr:MULTISPECIES: SRPBCC family protein [Rhodococcus]EID74190.1 hypothetical protein W59_30924 [Rhodococcus opacus RKJ300 = JCM 13270]EKT83942.1 hypothetical protein WSS_A04780 [Rhodococcus opacus M213]MBA8964984.1 uncharacterized protein YndB with AHSA1/START domain [Rhodococcus opacus]MBP2208536.1 uncharacterized protein YndB with AHSA1/START domain [Rhodococcus opacus]MDJ0412867.1 SRPBCC family protein [Rhodococcus opacus]
MALSVSGEFEIEAPQEQVMAALADVERIPEWSVVHKKVVVESRFDDGRPRTVRMTLAVLGVADTQLAEHKWLGDEQMSWTLLESEKQKCQEGEYRLTPTARGTSVHLTMSVEPKVWVPKSVLRQGQKQAVRLIRKGFTKFVLENYV